MSEELDTRTIEQSCDDEYGVHGDGLCEGEVACEAELASWRFSGLGVCQRVGADLRERRSAQGSGRRRSRSGGARERTRSAMRGVGEGGEPA
jgi:hypothetical protein